jgi:YVTN family beta-propeller protein
MKIKCPLPKGFSGTRRVSGILVGVLALLLTAASAAVAAPYAYVSNFIPGTVSVIDADPAAVCRTAGHTPPCVVKVLTVGALPGGVAVNPAGTFAYVANKDSNSISVIDVATNTVVSPNVPVGPEPWGVAVTADGSKVVVSLNGGIAVVDAATLGVNLIPRLGVLNGLVVVGSRVYVADATAGAVVVIDLNNPTPPFPEVIVGTQFNSQPMGIVANAAGTRVYVVDLIDDFVNPRILEVSAIDTATNTVVPAERVTIDGDTSAVPGGAALSPDGSRLFVTNDSLNRLTIVTLSNSSLRHVNVGSTPIGVATDPAGRAYVINAGMGGSVSIVDTAATAVCATSGQVPPCVVKTVPSVPMSFGFGAFVTAGPPAPAQFALNLSTNGTGSGSIGANPAASANGTYAAGTVVSLTPNPAASSQFTSWSGACSGTGPCTVTMNAAQSVTATFALKEYALTLLTNGSGSGQIAGSPAPENGTYAHGQTVTVTATSAASSQFSGWSGACSGTGACSVTMDGAKTVTASFGLKEYALTLSTGGTGSGSITGSPAPVNGTYTHGQTVTVTATPAASSQFSGWSGACSGTGACSVTMDGAKTVTASFTLKQFVLTVLTSGNGSVSANPAPVNGSYAAGTFVALTATPAAGFQFTSWSGACSGLGTCNVLMDAAKSVTATFTATTPPPSAQFTLTVNTVGSGSIAAEPPAPAAAAAAASSARSLAVLQPLAIIGKYNAGTLVTLTAVAAPGFKFTGWSTPCTGTGTCNVKMDADKTLTATFTVASEPPATCDEKIRDWQKKVADHKHPWWRNHQLRISLKMYEEAQEEVAKARAKVGERDKRYQQALKELDNGKSALCHGHYWRADNEFWDAFQIARQILKQARR